MPRFKAATSAHQFAGAETTGQKLWLASYGRATESKGGALVCEINRHENIARGIKRLIAGRPKFRGKLQPILKRAEGNAAEAQKELDDKCAAARRSGNYCFFLDVADAVKVIAEAKDNPVDNYRHEIVVLLYEPQTGAKPTKRQIVDHLCQKFPELSDKDDLPREVYRWCKQLGLEPARASRARTNIV